MFPIQSTNTITMRVISVRKAHHFSLMQVKKNPLENSY